MTTADTNGRALAVRERDISDLAPTFVVSLDDLKRQLAQLEQFKREIMIRGTDYGEIPGTDKPTLLKPGAEKLTLAFGLAPVPTTTNKVEDWDSGLFHYEVRCDLISKRTGQVVASAHGSANTREPRYRWRKAERQCTVCGKPAVIKGKAQYGGGWLCFKKLDGCGAKFKEDDARITQQVVGNIANPEPYELVNTVLKMAEKRALVAATLLATGGSGTWTQDIEDMPSVADDQVMEEYVPTQEREVNDRPMVTSADDRIWKRWLEVKAQAEKLGIRVSERRLPIPRDELAAAGSTVFEAIEVRKQQLASEEAARTTGKAAEYDRIAGSEQSGTFFDNPDQHTPGGQPVSPKMVKTIDDPLYQLYADRAEQAAQLGIEFEVLVLPETVVKVTQLGRQLTAKINAAQADAAKT